ncbi:MULTISPECIES: undecaprenyldiphospho-muramoylpentapeptide beta-N-acetylglucosaminyltransferase [Enterococcus]|uniref:UDP-N-acetylglucosamine--N-acetylmuramyl-(pentapeptide) pyrophosphoryl-undecaprenol N-acetylglucosamine transferase n=1 Tax=Enterococcus malodoratus ATCC 43197 TaxID=1158601 RepID=R2P758_9ENTE|nr:MULTISPECIES: undecaprenyldiphospho-muramoylpentapeptide beta-N-acetylglucosaminyltransferase [Enterococcus]EOH78993.1 undecaprenyldiphospho-muramoylpentapeptide beta-N-acetylglucosaminyltransferase [Enterococcus malodoratus ATCC 43197]EOT64582.1 undecaprenyldiphospho-muramoylpentapeptide beta-N-acetylglucosaminyltransferase [Enterococcus malodoratus ATCC 43197]OJG65618.1 undecaprenyldiphospho-muramoylpentapeptide beta-N-acetylglucosaminyltransferase [Enterococcus malodoratus]SPW92616.1 unde
MRILVTGGGTGGHIYPALAFIRYVQKIQPDSEFLYVGTHRGLENKIVPETGISFKTIKIQGFKRKLSLDNIKTVQLFLESIKRSKEILREFKPDVVIGTGGYVSGSVVYAAARMKIPTIVHEQNSVPGMTNKFLSRFADRVGICFPDAAQYFPESKTVLVGNPRAQEVVTSGKSEVLEQYGLLPDIPTVLIFGGSQGALKINQAVIQALPKFSQKDYQVLYASGDRYYNEIKEKFDVEKINRNLSLQPYIKNMTDVMANVDLLIGRAGATSIAELTALGLPAILIPSPYVTNDHQTKNAQSLVNAGAVKMIPDADLTGESLIDAVDEIMNDSEKREAMAKASRQEGIPDAAERLWSLVNEIVG